MIARFTLLFALLSLLAPTALAAPADAERSLEAITIEGVVDSPEVLFINARQPVRLGAEFGWRLLDDAGLLTIAIPAPLELSATPLLADVAPDSTPSEE